MIYYKQIDIDNLEVIQTKTLDYIHFYHIHGSTGFVPINFDSFNEYCPEILTAFDRYNIKPIKYVAVVARANNHIGLHVDATDENCRINIPILNCEGAKTQFFAGGLFERNYNRFGTPYNELVGDVKNIVKADEVELTKATVIRVLVPHLVKVNSVKIPRIALSIKFDVDPEFLLNI